MVDEDDAEDRTQRLVAELAEVRRRMSLRAMPAVRPKSEAPAAPRPALGRLTTERIVIDEEAPGAPSGVQRVKK